MLSSLGDKHARAMSATLYGKMLLQCSYFEGNWAAWWMLDVYLFPKFTPYSIFGSHVFQMEYDDSRVWDTSDKHEDTQVFQE